MVENENGGIFPSLSRTEFEFEVNKELASLQNKMEDCNKFNESVKENLKNIKVDFDSAISRENVLKRRLEQEVNKHNKREKESASLISELKDAYDRNMVKLREHHQKKIFEILDKHKLEMQKWKSRYEKLKFEKKVDQGDHDDSFADEKLHAENKTLKLQNETLEQELKQTKKEMKTIQDNYKSLQKDYEKQSAQLITKNKDLSESKQKIEEFEQKIKENESIIKEKTDKLKTKQESYSELKSRFDKVSNDYETLKGRENKFDDDSNAKRQNNDSTSSDMTTADQKNWDLTRYKEELAILRVELRSVNDKFIKKGKVVEYLRDKNSEINSEMSKLQELFDENKRACEEHMKQIENFQSDIDRNNNEIVARNDQILELKSQIEDCFQNMDLKIKEINDIKRSEKKWKDKCSELEKKHQLLLKEIETIKRKNAALQVEIDRRNHENDNLNLEKKKLTRTNETLKKLCTELETQVDTYSKKCSEVLNAKKSLIKQKSSHDDELSFLHEELSRYKEMHGQLKQENEEYLSKLSQTELEMKNSFTEQKIQVDKLIRENQLEQEKCKQLEDTVDWLHESIEDLEQQLVSLNDERFSITAELSQIKEEASKHITKVSELEQEKRQLLEELQVKSEYEEELIERINFLRDHLKSKEDEMNRNQFALGQTFSQQMKLIKLLQEKAECPKKKPSFFHLSSPKILSQNYHQKFQEAQRSYNLEKTKNYKLNEQLKETNLELERNLVEVKNLKMQMYELQKQFAQNKHESQQKVQSSHSGSYKYTHSFVPIKITFPSECVSCLRKIFFGQKARKCQDCKSIIHATCNLANNCGIPIEEVRRRLHEDSSMCSSSEDFNKSDSIEPSAPEIALDTFSNVETKTLEQELDKILSSPKNKSNQEHFSFSDSMMEILKQ
ncbi:hypothetical protein RDWZM_007353 [Blomia tropicalis]|uniref:Phorbol-ester/DAG-type domain-containing protein n=1 Tax=Blomia tropicalis TaxID=40697 RepID=A0A9Q0LZP1_BLOTA|nr:hypothetical protein RDWZM_007353 [Blomia tropicalis]